jgi:multisubunit Na+/H+ antiporter MnhE subunit
MFGRILLAIPLAVLWMLIIDDISAASFALGIVIGLAALAVAGSSTSWIKRGDAIPQGIAILRFLFSLMRDILLSSVFVARRVLSLNMRLKPAVVAVKVGRNEHRDPIIAFSANAISLTPGELVVSIEFADDNDPNTPTVMFVHTLDLDITAPTADEVQAKRLKLLRRALGEKETGE